MSSSRRTRRILIRHHDIDEWLRPFGFALLYDGQNYPRDVAGLPANSHGSSARLLRDIVTEKHKALLGRYCPKDAKGLGE